MGVNPDAARCRPSLGVSILIAEGSIKRLRQPLPNHDSRNPGPAHANAQP